MREQARAETRRRIVVATAALHARQGAAATTYADIAAAADVAVPTVYNHFPTRADLLEGCVTHVLAGAPGSHEDPFADVHRMRDRIGVAARTLFAMYEYLQPWLSWTLSELAQVPELRPYEERRKELRQTLVARAFEPRFGKRVPSAVTATASALLDFPSWLTLCAHTGKRNAARVAGESLAAVALQHKPRVHARKEKRQ